jgi:hypothetical protein
MGSTVYSHARVSLVQRKQTPADHTCGHATQVPCQGWGAADQLSIPGPLRHPMSGRTSGN